MNDRQRCALNHPFLKPPDDLPAPPLREPIDLGGPFVMVSFLMVEKATDLFESEPFWHSMAFIVDTEKKRPASLRELDDPTLATLRERAQETLFGVGNDPTAASRTEGSFHLRRRLSPSEVSLLPSRFRFAAAEFHSKARGETPVA